MTHIAAPKQKDQNELIEQFVSLQKENEAEMKRVMTELGISNVTDPNDPKVAESANLIRNGMISFYLKLYNLGYNDCLKDNGFKEE